MLPFAGDTVLSDMLAIVPNSAEQALDMVSVPGGETYAQKAARMDDILQRGDASTFKPLDKDCQHAAGWLRAGPELRGIHASDAAVIDRYFFRGRDALLNVSCLPLRHLRFTSSHFLLLVHITFHMLAVLRSQRVVTA